MGELTLVLRLIAAVALVAGCAAVSYWGAARLRLTGALERWCAIPVIGMALATLAFHALLPLHLFRLPYVLVGMGLLVTAIFAPASHRALLVETAARDRRLLSALARRVRRSRHFAWVVTVAVLCIPVILRPFIVVPVAWDTTMYHGTKAAYWVQQGGAPALSLDPGVPSWLLTRNHLAGGDVFLAWAMLPMSGDLYVGVVSLVQWLALGLAVLLLARELGVREPAGSTVAAFLLALAPLRLQVGSGYVELTLALTMASALAFTLRYLRTGHAGALLVAGAAIGLACGVKILALPIGGLMLIFVAFRALHRRDIRPLAAGVLVAVVLGAPWFVYNLVDTGAPLSPAAVKILGMPIGFTNEAYRHIKSLWHPPAYQLATEWSSFSTTFGAISSPRETAGWPVLVGFGLFLCSLPALVKRRPAAALLLAAIVVANLAVVYSPKFTPWRLLAPENTTRFYITAMLVVLPVSALACGLPLIGRIYRAFLLAFTIFNLVRFAVVGVAKFELDDMMMVLGGVALLAVVDGVLRGRLAPRPRIAVTALFGLSLLALVAAERESHRYEGAKQSFFIHSLHRNWVECAEALDDGPTHVVAVTHGINDFVDSGMFYFMFGRSLQNRLLYVPVTRDGSRIFSPWDQTEALDYDVWLGRLDERGVERVMSMQPRTIELEWMEKHPERFVKMLGDVRTWALYRVLPRTP